MPLTVFLSLSNSLCVVFVQSLGVIVNAFQLRLRVTLDMPRDKPSSSTTLLTGEQIDQVFNNVDGLLCALSASVCFSLYLCPVLSGVALFLPLCVSVPVQSHCLFVYQIFTA